MVPLEKQTKLFQSSRGVFSVFGYHKQATHFTVSLYYVTRLR